MTHHLSFLCEDHTKLIRVGLVHVEGEPGSASIEAGWSVDTVEVFSWPEMHKLDLSETEQNAIDEEVDAKLALGV
jgi:hypothetical protein